MIINKNKDRLGVGPLQPFESIQDSYGKTAYMAVNPAFLDLFSHVKEPGVKPDSTNPLFRYQNRRIKASIGQISARNSNIFNTLRRSDPESHVHVCVQPGKRLANHGFHRYEVAGRSNDMFLVFGSQHIEIR